MTAPARSVAWIVIPALTFAVGFLLGSGSGSTSDNSDTATLLARQEELIRLLRDQPAGRSTTAPSPARPSSALAADPNAGSGEGMRLPSLDPWLARIEESVRALEAAAERAAATAPVSTTEIVRRAADPNLPRNDRELKRFIREYETVEMTEHKTNEEYEDAWRNLKGKYRYQTMEKILERFGRPDEIEVEVGSVWWYYYQEIEHADGFTEVWSVDLSFYDGALVDFSGYWDRPE